MTIRKYLFGLLLTITTNALCQQVPDTLHVPPVLAPRYGGGTGPIVMIDEAHHNFHTATRRFRPFAMLLENDGYKIRRGTEEFSKKSLEDIDVLVIANALNKRNEKNWFLPTPSAFEEEEIKSVVSWVKEGGALFLIADHMPFPGCNEKLAAAFGFKFYNGFSFDTTKGPGPDYFSVANKRLVASSITQGMDTIVSFTGQGFDVPTDAKPILQLDEKFKIWISDTAWVFNKGTRRISATGKFQGASLTFGKGRVIVFGEAAMFTAQLAGNGARMGFNHPRANRNTEFLLRLMHWLDGGRKSP